MRFIGVFISIILLLVMSAAGQTPPGKAAAPGASAMSFPTKPGALIVCAGNVPPDNTVITATGTSFTCSGPCRSREVEPAQGPIMIICAGQPIPQFYETESVTSSPACNCLGDQDNAYVIRRINGAPTPTPVPSPGAQGEAVPFAPNSPASDVAGVQESLDLSARRR